MTDEYIQSPQVKRRVAAEAVRSIVNFYGLGTQAVTLAPDNPEDWTIDDHIVMVLVNRRPLAEVIIIDNVARLTINDLYNLIRDDKIGDFEPDQYGLIPQRARDPITGLKRNDIEAEIDLPEIDKFLGPAVVIPRSPLNFTPRVIRSLR